MERPELAGVIAETFELELARELILHRNDMIDEARFTEAAKVGKGNWVDIATLYDLLEIAKTLK